MNPVAQRPKLWRFWQAALVTLFGLVLPQISRAAIYACVDTDGRLLISTRQEDARYRRFDPQQRLPAWQPESRAVIGSSLDQQDQKQPFSEIIEQIAQQVGVSPHLLHAVIEVESAYHPDAVSSKGAQGLMQLIPATAARFQVGDVTDPASNIRAGASYLKVLLDRFHNDLSLALAAYNAGEGAIQRYHNTMPPFPETEAYVKRVLTLFEQRLNRKRTRS